MVVLDERNDIQAEVTDIFGRENDTEIAKVAWLSRRDIPKAYGSMVVYLKALRSQAIHRGRVLHGWRRVWHHESV
jgi:hypothetical protein